jgi:hypothetical protein
MSQATLGACLSFSRITANEKATVISNEHLTNFNNFEICCCQMDQDFLQAARILPHIEASPGFTSEQAKHACSSKVDF